MGLSELTDPGAVRRALNEHDEIGREAFLAKYVFGEATRYFIERDGRRYDSKAIVGAAHGFQHGVPLTSEEFSGGERTVVQRLNQLGFEVVRPHAGWTIPIGAVLTRSEIKDLYGGSIFGGIEPSRTTPNIMIYTDPAQGALNGYNYDGWDAEDPEVFYYTGEGRRGNQTLREGNKAIAEHSESGRTIRLFEALDHKQRRGGKRQQYVGAFRLDDSAPFEMKPAPDADGDPRQVIVFRLLRDEIVGAHVHRRAEHEAVTLEEPAGPLPAPRPADGGPPSTPPVTRVEHAPDFELVAPEQNLVDSFAMNVPKVGRDAVRKEAQLVRAFEAWLVSRGHEVKRARIPIPGEKISLISDTYDVTDSVLYEAKSGTDRATVRLAIGQLLDYLRFLPPETRGALLLPDEPSPDLRRLIESCGFGLAYKKLGSWVIETHLNRTLDSGSGPDEV